jgi:hypothetical protein
MGGAAISNLQTYNCKAWISKQGGVMNRRHKLSQKTTISSLAILICTILLCGCGDRESPAKVAEFQEIASDVPESQELATDVVESQESASNVPRPTDVQESQELASDVLEFQELVSMQGETSIELIERAVQEGEIPYETSLLYKMYAVFGDNKLPEEYRSTKKFRNSDGVVEEVISNLETLSQEVQDELAPFFRRPNDPESYFNIKYRNAKLDNQIVQVSYTYPDRPVNVISESIESANGLVKFWYPSITTNTIAYKGKGTIDVSSDDAKKMAERLKQAIDEDEIMERFYDLLQRNIVKDGTRGGDDRLDVYVVPNGGLGSCVCEGNQPCSTFILINTNIGLHRPNILITTLAHEIFHSFQFAYERDDEDDDWWSEATAVWSEDFIYPGLNTEQSYLKTFIYHPQTELFSRTDPTYHHYGAYIFPYYLSESTSQDSFIKETWEGCGSQTCLKAIDAAIDGGYKKQWREFTLWNYNKDPAKYYGDVGGFPDISSEDSSNFGETEITGKEIQLIDIDTLKPLSAFLNKAINITDDSIKRLVFKDINTFTGINENAAIKAIIYYTNGKKEVEDWTDIQQRSFCIENPDEDFLYIMFIFSNADMEKSISESNINVVGKESCYHIEQEDDRTATIHFPTVSMGATVEVNSFGEPEEEAEEGQEYAYLTKWKVLIHYEVIKDAFSIDCEGSSVDYGPGWTTRSATYFVFDLGPEGLNEDNTFSIDYHYGLPHPKGNYELIPDINIGCVDTFFAAEMMDLSGYTGVIEDMYIGRIYDMTENGARIEVIDCCYLHDCSYTTGETYQDISEPVILEIKKSEQ